MSHCFPISSIIDFNRVNFPMCFEMGKQSPIHIHKHNWYISFFDLKICGVNKWQFQISQNVRSCYAQKPKVDNFPISCTSHVLLVCLRSLDVIPHLLAVVVFWWTKVLILALPKINQLEIYVFQVNGGTPLQKSAEKQKRKEERVRYFNLCQLVINSQKCALTRVIGVSIQFILIVSFLQTHKKFFLF